MERKIDKIKLKIYNEISWQLMHIEDFFSWCQDKVINFRCKFDDKVDEIDLKYGEN